MTIILVAVSYFLVGLFSVISDLNAGPMDAKGWTRNPTIGKILFFSLIWFIGPILETFPGQPNRARTIAYGLLGSTTKLGIFSFYLWVTWSLSNSITDNTILAVILSLVIYSTLVLLLQYLHS